MSSCFPTDFGRTLALMLLEIKAELDDLEYCLLDGPTNSPEMSPGAEQIQAVVYHSTELI